MLFHECGTILSTYKSMHINEYWRFEPNFAFKLLSRAYIVHSAYTSGKRTPGGGTMTPFHSLCLKHQHFYCEVRGQSATGCVVLRFLRAFIGLCAAVQAKHGGCTSSSDRWANSRNIAVRTCAVRLLSAPDDRRLQPSADGQRWDIQGESNSKNQGEPFRPYRSVTQAARVTLQSKVDSQ